MLTGITARGYKSFAPRTGVSLPLTPFTVIVGPNNSGKSNLFDLLQLVSHLAHQTFREAFAAHRGDPADAFWAGYGEDEVRHFEVTLAFDRGTLPPYGAEYSLRLEFDPVRRRLGLADEALIVLNDDGSVSWAGIETRTDGDGKRVLLKSGSQALPEILLGQAERTVLAQVHDGRYALLSKIRQEMASWRVFHLNPQAIRTPSADISSWDIEPDGGGLPTVLATLQREAEFNPEYRKRLQAIRRELRRVTGVLDDVQARSSGDGRLVLTFEQDGHTVPARLVSDGALRMLTLLTLAYSPHPPALIALEEPENGIHPHLLHFVVDLLRGISRRRRSPVQVLLNSHSPHLVDLAEPHELVQARMVAGATRFERVSLNTRPALRELLEQGTYTLGEVYAGGSLMT